VYWGGRFRDRSTEERGGIKSRGEGPDGVKARVGKVKGARLLKS